MGTSVRKATSDDLAAIKIIADSNKTALGFVTKPALLVGISRGWLLVAENESRIIGFVHYRHRRDGQTTVYEICVDQQFRGQGVGHLLIRSLIQEAQLCICLKAVVGLPANGFYEHLGFELIRTEQGKKRALNVWRYERKNVCTLFD